MSTEGFDSKTLDYISEDSFLSCFLNDSYRHIVGGDDGQLSTEEAAKVASAVEALTQDIYAIVTDHYTSLIEQAEKLDALQLIMSRFQERVNNLIAGVEKLRSKLNEPYNRISRRMVLLLRLKSTSDLLRKVIRVVQLSKRVAQMNLLDADKQPTQRDIAKCNQLISEIDALVAADEQLQRIDVIQSDLTSVAEVKDKLASLSSKPTETNTNTNSK